MIVIPRFVALNLKSICGNRDDDKVSDDISIVSPLTYNCATKRHDCSKAHPIHTSKKHLSVCVCVH